MNCHSSDRTLIKFSDYESIYGRRAMIKYTIENDLMPPWSVAKHIGHWKNDLSLTTIEKQIFLEWLDSGLPYKKKNIKLFDPKSKSLNIIKDPDYVIKLKEPIEVPATGFLPYKELIFETGFTEDKWIKEIEFVLKPKVVHHVVIRIMDKKYLSQIKEKKNSNLFHSQERRIWGWVPGRATYKNFGKDIGIKIPKNTFLLMRIHYEPIGEKVMDLETNVKFKFHLKTPKYSHFIADASRLHISIPAYHDNYLIESKYKVKEDIKLIDISPHMHFRGKSSSVFVINPKGKNKEIFRLYSYNFNFQNIYTLKNPLLIRKGSVLLCKNWFDNSAKNPVNPDPSVDVSSGFYTKDEMSMCYFSFIIPSSKEHVEYVFTSSEP